MMTRADFQRLAELRVAETEALVKAGQWAGAYYLAGYAVEHALKACIAKQTRAEEYPPNDTKGSHYTHNLNTLVKTAGLFADLDTECKTDNAFKRYWNIVTAWNEHARYSDVWQQSDVEGLVEAITEPNHGVLRWIRARW